MIASFFRRLEHHDVKWLLISGQASILYGAATFSEDIDLWLMPTQLNFERFLKALREVGARYYKLTPAFTVEHSVRRHGFHFVLPATGKETECYLDVMGHPPRARAFEAALREACDVDADWGLMHTVGIKDLVELKKTQRARDYPVIGRLVLAYLRDHGPEWSEHDIGWALANMFSLDEFRRMFVEHPAMHRVLPAGAPPVVMAAAAQLERDGQLAQILEDELDDWLQARAAPLRRADRHFWRPVIDDLRDLRRRGELMPEGSLV